MFITFTTFITTEKRTHIIYVYIIMPTYYKYGYKFVAPSNTEHKKYDVYDVKTDKKIASFGDRRYEHYHDKIGYYSHLNHNDVVRKKLYRIRHAKDIHNMDSAGGFSFKFLWS